MDPADTSRADEEESPESETWRYLERLEQRAQLRKIRRTPLLTQETVPVEVQPAEAAAFSDEDDLL
jgi:hypothetical protein